MLLAVSPPGRALSSRFLRFYAAVVLIQGVHVVEHVIQLIQVYAFGVPDDDALALLGYLFAIQDTEEWLHLAFNSAYVVALYVLLFPLWELQLRRVVAPCALWAFLLGGVGLESWHLVEHLVIIGNVVRNDGCPCPGLGDRALGVTDTQLHFAYNAIAYAATLAPFPFTVRSSREGSAR